MAIRKRTGPAHNARNKRGRNKKIRTVSNGMRIQGTRRKTEMGRPSRLYPPRIDTTVDELVSKMFSLTPEQSEAIRNNQQPKEFRCQDCKRLVYYPEILYQDGLCETCHVE